MSNEAVAASTSSMGKLSSTYCNIKYVALVLLVLQNTLVVVFTGLSRNSNGNSPMYASTTAVVITEVLKMLSCFLVIGYEAGGVFGLLKCLHDEIIAVPMELVKLAVPSFLYTLQNNLLYVALSNLDPATFQVGYQLKILTTAVFSVIMLNKSISRLQWGSLVLLTAGVALCQLSSRRNHKGTSDSNAIGCAAVLLATTLSGFAGVYFERILKGSQTSLWMRNVQMSFSSIIVGMLTVRMSSDWSSVQSNGFFFGYTNIVWFVIALQAIGGLLVAVVVKYTDNILKGFATSASIITSSLLAVALFGFEPSLLFIISVSMVIYSMYLYSYQPPPLSNDSLTPDDIMPMLEDGDEEKFIESKTKK